VTLGLFMLGICLGRSHFFGDPAGNRALVKKIMRWSAVLTIISFVLMIAMFSQTDQPQTLSTWTEAIALTFYDWFNLSLSAVFACAFLLLIVYRKAVLQSFAPYGRMALTNYLLLSLMGTLIFYGSALDYLGEWPNRYILLLAVTVAAAQMWLSAI